MALPSKVVLPSDHIKSKPLVIIKDFTTKPAPLAPLEVSPVILNEQGASRASTHSMNADNVILANIVALGSEETPINENLLDVMDDDIQWWIFLFVWLISAMLRRSERGTG